MIPSARSAYHHRAQQQQQCSSFGMLSDSVILEVFSKLNESLISSLYLALLQVISITEVKYLQITL